MSVEIIPVDPHYPDPTAIQRAAEVLHRGGLVAFPTETVYGLGAHALDAVAVRKIFAAKGRPAGNPLIVHVHSAERAQPLVSVWPTTAEKLSQRFWPGPLTLVLPRSEAVPDIVTGGGSTVALRVPCHPVALALLEACALPLAAPSANRSSGLSPTRGEHVLRDLADRIDLLLDAGPTSGGLESTVIDLSGPAPRLLRPGLVTVTDIEKVLGSTVIRPDIHAGEEVMPSPGMLARHYAPRTPLEVVAGSGRERIEELCQQGLRVGWVTHRAEELIPHGVLLHMLPDKPAGYAAQLYAVLHDLDAAGLNRIIVAAPPESDAWLAIRDRLHRASTEK